MSADPNSAHRSRRLKWLRRALIGLPLVLLAMWLFGGVSWCLHQTISASFADRNYEAAEQWIELTHRLRCNNAETHFWQARLARKQLRITEVPALLLTAKEAGFDEQRIRTEYLLLEAQTGRIREVADQLNDLLASGSQDSAEICEAYVNGAMIAGATDVAMTILPVWKSEFPDDPQPWYAQARILEYQQNVNGALQELDEAIRRKPDHWPSRYSRGRILYVENRIEESLKEFEITSQMKRNAAALYQQARCLRSLSRLEDAHQLLDEILKRESSQISASFDDVAEPVFGRPIQYEMGTLEAALGHNEAAKKWLDEVLEAEPNHLDARYARGVVLRELGDVATAEAELAEVGRIRELLTEIDRLVDEINKTPNEPHVEKRCRVGELFLTYENAKHGEFWLREALNRDPNYRPAHALLAQYYEKLSATNSEYRFLADEHRKAAQETDSRKPDAIP